LSKATLSTIDRRSGAPEPTPRQRVAALSSALSDRRRHGLDAVLGGAQPPRGDTSPWIDLAEALGRDFLSDFDVDGGHLQELVRRRLVDGAMLRTAGRIYQALRHRPLAEYPTLADGLRQSGIAASAYDFTREILFQLFVVEINRRLQLIYQAYLARRPFPEHADESGRIAHLQPLAATAHRLIAATDPGRLLRWLGMADDVSALRELTMALNKYFFDPYRINFRFTYHCNIQCAHCYNFSGPGMKGNRIDTDAMLRIVEGMPETGMRNMNLTGGEPFMYMDTVLALVRAARDAGVPIISTYTNGFFARTEENCRKVLGRLADAGFMAGPGARGDHIKVSAGVFHQEFLPFETVITLIRVYREMFGKNIVVDYEVLENDPGVQQVIEEQLRDKGVRDLVDINFRGIAPVGRGTQFEGDLRHRPVDDYPACTFIDEIVFDPDGSVRPCCGMNFGNDGIAIGNLHESGLKALLMGLENNALLQFINANPIGHIFDQVDKDPAAAGYANICNLCNDAVGELQDSQPLKRRLAVYQDYFPFWFEADRFATA